MFILRQFIQEHVTHRPVSLFEADLRNQSERVSAAVSGRSVCVVGGAGSIGSAFIKALLPFHPRSLVVVDLNENALAELTRDLRSTYGLEVPADYRAYTLHYADPIFARIFREERGFDIVANFSAHKHVRSEKDKYAVQALLENNDLKAKRWMDLLCEFPPQHFFCVSTDKAANPVNIMGASKRVMEDMVMAYRERFPVTTARFANVAFSQASLPDGWMQRLFKKQPLVAPTDVKRYFVSPEEAGQLCLMACVLGNSGEIFFPKLQEGDLQPFTAICDAFIEAQGMEKVCCGSAEEARRFAAEMPYGGSRCPVYYAPSDTTGEKAFEEFYVSGERTDMQRYAAMGVIVDSPRKPMAEVEALFRQLEDLFSREFSKEEVVRLLQGFLPQFVHEEKGKSLDQKM